MTPVRGLATLVVAAVATISCTSLSPSVVGSGRAVTQPRDVEGFSDVRVGSAVKATVIVGPDTSVTVTADDNVQANVQTNVFAGRLTVSVNGNLAPKTPIQVAITTPNLDTIEATSAANVIATGVNADEFHATADSAASLTVRGNATQSTCRRRARPQQIWAMCRRKRPESM